MLYKEKIVRITVISTKSQMKEMSKVKSNSLEEGNWFRNTLKKFGVSLVLSLTKSSDTISLRALRTWIKISGNWKKIDFEIIRKVGHILRSVTRLRNSKNDKKVVVKSILQIWKRKICCSLRRMRKDNKERKEKVKVGLQTRIRWWEFFLLFLFLALTLSLC